MSPHPRTIAAVLTVLAALPAGASAQTATVSTEADVTVGYSSEDAVSASAAQVRMFGETPSRLRFNVEGTWGNRSSNTTDAFGAASGIPAASSSAKPTSSAWLSASRRPTASGSASIAARSGTPVPATTPTRGSFAPRSMRDHGYWAVTNNFLERGVDLMAATQRFSIEASLGTPGDTGIARRRAGLDAVVHAQAHVLGATLGVSRMSSEPYGDTAVSKGRVAFTGVDARWMRGGVQLRGEWLGGRAWKGTTTTTWDVDASVHRQVMGPITAVIRTERLSFASVTPYAWRDMMCDEDWHGLRHSVGARVRLPAGVTAQLSLVRQAEELAEDGARTALDLALSIHSPSIGIG